MTIAQIRQLSDKTLYVALQSALTSKGYKFFDKGNYNLNLIGIRSGARQAGKFDDLFCAVYRDMGLEVVKRYECTTDAGTYWMQNPMNKKGTSMLVPGQYDKAYKIGKHKGYSALVQSAPLNVWRDNNKDIILDTNVESEWGMFGVNIHRAAAEGKSTINSKWSAGCQVLSSSDDFKELMKIANRSVKIHGDSFTYTLIEENDVRLF